MSAGGDHRGDGGPHDPQTRVGSGKPARRRIAAFAVGVIVIVFSVLLGIWLLARSAAAHSPSGVEGLAHHSVEAAAVANGAARTSVEPGGGGDRAA